MPTPPNKLLDSKVLRRARGEYYGRAHGYLLPRGILLRPLLSSRPLSRHG